ncbi:MAG TPA: non-ribosomal peptide synthase/polyketide synthase [Thermoanaerobaculia bacterium]|jgi:amino acid adenylation domain-containing protein
MTDLSKILTDLSPEQRELFLLRLKKKQAREPISGRVGRIPPRDPGREDFPLSFSQQRLWFLDQWEPGNSAYNIFGAVRLEGTLDLLALVRTFEEIVRRHESLRTSFSAQGGQPRQVISPPRPFVLPLADLSGLDLVGAQAEARLLAAGFANHPFDLARGPFLRLALLRLSPREHWALLAMHHIVADGWSMGVFNRELAALYATFRQGGPVLLPPLPIQYADYALWQREWLQGEVLGSQLAFWRKLLAGASPLIELPLDHPRAAGQGSPAGHRPVRIARDLAGRLQALALSEGGTLFMVLLAGFSTLLSRYSGSEDVVVGSPVANRNRSEVEGLIGFFANILALRVDLSGDPTCRELLRRARAVTSEAYDHQDLPFELLVDELQPERDPSHPPLVQVTLALQNLPMQAVELAGLRLAPVPVDSAVAKFELGWTLGETLEGLAGDVEYNRNLFEPATIARMTGHFEALLAGIASRPDRRLSDLPLLAPAEEQQVIVDWNVTTTAYPRDRSLAGLFEEQAAATPGVTAVVFGEEALSYAALNARVNRLAHRLRRLGVSSEVPVGLCAERSLDLVVAMLAIVKAGGAYLPLDPAYPRERLAVMLEDSGAPLVLVHERLRDRMPMPTPEVFLLDGMEEALADESEADLAGGAGPEHLAYIIYTSGSTGRPKGVAVPHRAVVRLVRETDYAQLGPRDRVAQASNTSFDAATFEVWGALLNGGCLVGVSRELALSPGEFAAALRERGITTLFLTTALFNQMVRVVPDAFSTLTHVLFGGEAVDPSAVRRALTEGPPQRLLHVYGPTESTTYATWHHVERVGEADATVPIGQPIANTVAFVLDRWQRPVPVGVPGELCLGGDGLARGYFGRPDLTAERFIPDPASGQPGARLYRTGDLVRRRGDGAIEFLGRFDLQVKIRGFRIELGEIEAALLRYPAVKEAVVLAREDAPGDRRLAAYVVPKDGAVLDASALRAFLAPVLPEYMIPAAWVFLDALPLNPNGKVDRRTLPAPDRSRPGTDGGWTPPRNPTETLLAAIWAEVLGVERVGVEDDFFELGGNSLLSLQVIARAGQAGLPIHVRQLFEYPTIAELAAALGAAPCTARAALPIEPVLRDGPLPLSFAQQRLWFLDRLEPGSPAYNIFTGLRLAGPLRLPVLARALAEVVRRHEALRTVFAVGDGEPVQIVLPVARPPLPLADLSALPARERRAAARRLATEEASRPFDLALGPLLRAVLLRFTPEEHVAFLTMHHIVSDGWSMGILVREVTALYRALLEGAPPLPELPVQYADFAQWQRRWLSGEILEREVAWWRERLAGAPPVLELPADLPRPPVQRYRGAAETRVLPPGLLAELDALARREDATLFMVLLAAAQALLCRVTGQEDVVVGSPVANRNRVEIEPLIGFFVNTLVLRTGLAGDPTFREALARVRETTLGAYAHQDLPFERLVEELRPERSLSHAPIFQVMVVLQNAPRQDLSLPGLAVETFAGDQTTAKFDLLFLFAESPQGLVTGLEYNTDLFFPATAKRLLGHLERLLAVIVREPERRLAELPLLTAGERQQILCEWNDTAVAWPEEACLHELIEQQAERSPDAAAAVFDGEVLSYADLDARANRWARVLQRLGVGPEVLVGVCLERSLEMVVGLLAILKAGGAYVPIDPSYPRERLAWMFADSRVMVLLTQERLAPGLPLPEEGGPRILCLDAPDGPAAAEAARPVRSGAVPGSAAYAIYTSGSTGRPKGAINTHRGIVNRLLWMQRIYGLGLEDRVLQKTPFSFDVSVWELFWPLLTGARLVIARPGGHQDSAYLIRAIAGEGVTTLHFVPSMLQVFLEEPAVAQCTSLRRVIASGEALPAELRDRFFQHLPTGVELHNLYGPTEAAVDVTYEPCAAGSAGAGVPIGRPVANKRIHLLDWDMRPVPAGVTGELHIGGVQLARGYLGRPQLTAERFMPDPCGMEPGARLYKTGDLARHLPDGRIEYLGRLDFQVKIRGFRIELGEIEAALDRQPGVRESVVVARGEGGDRRLVAYVVPARREEPPSPAGLREALRASLPAHMVPTAFVVLGALPLSPNGKVDRKALPDPEVGPAGERVAAPQTPTEELLAGIWAAVLGVPAVGRDDKFFDLGGHSLLASQVISRIRDVFGVELPLRTLFERPTVAALAREVESGGALRAVPIMPVPRDGTLPLSFAQQRIWFLEQLEPGSAFYSIPAAFRLEGSLAPAVLAASLREIARRHESLRTTFGERDGEPFQAIAPAPDLDVPIIDLSGLPEPTREGTLHRIATEDARRPFDLARGPLARATLLRAAAADHVLLLNLHHIITDGWSTGVLAQELIELYRAVCSERPSRLPELPVQYADFAVWQRSWLQGEVLAAQLGYWRRQLAGVVPLELPLDRPRPSVESFRGSYILFDLSSELTAALHDLARRRGVTLFMALLAAWQALLGRLTGQEDVPVGTPVANRNRVELERLIGFFANTLVLRADLAGDPVFGELLGRVRETALGAYAHQDLPFEKLVEELQPERSLDRNPLFQVMLVLQNQPRPEADLGGLALRSLALHSGTAKFDLTLFWQESEGRLRGLLEYNTDLFDPATVRRLLGVHETFLREAAAVPDRPLSSLPVLSGAERHQVFVEWNDTAAGWREDILVIQRFEAQARRSPEVMAVEHGSERLTYGELERRANRLACALRRRGAGPDAVVGLCLDRSLDAMIALLAVLKAGGAYAPLDPAYPRERLAFMVEESRMRVLVTREPLLGVLPEGLANRGVQLLLLGGSHDAEIDVESAAGSVVQPENMLYVLYTSGSTGRPKGVALSHGALANMIAWQLRASVPGPLRTLQFASLSFDVSFQEIFATWGAGGTLVLISEEERRDPAALLRVLTEGRIERLFLPFVALQQLAETALERGLLPTSLREIVTAGEQLQATGALAELFRRLPGCTLHNHYGPTEAHVVTALRLSDDPGLWPRLPPIGRPIANLQVLLLDRRGLPLPLGTPGEVFIGGHGLARGYLHRPDLTSERFVPSPQPGQPGERLYRTGDLARLLPDGTLEFLGRADSQVKIRGFRVEPGEIEAVLAGHPQVRAAAVVARERGGGIRRLVVYVVALPGESPSPADLTRFLRGALPEYMVPSALVLLPEFPLTPSGKVDRQSLPEPEALGPEAPEGYEPPRTPAEEIVAGVWAEVLGLPRIGARDDFFDLGGHSLLATRVVSRLRATLGIDLPVRRLFEATTVATLAAAAEAARRAGEGEEAPPLVPRTGAGGPPLSFAQERLWFLDRLEPGTSAYNLALPVRLRGRLDRMALAGALDELARRHESLRTTFPSRDGQPVQRIAPAAGVPLPCIDLRSLPAERRDTELAARLAEEGGRSFDLAVGPLVRALLLQTADDEHAFLVAQHHILTDGWSMGVLIRELGALYGAFVQGRPSPLPEPTLQYADFAIWQRSWLQGEALAHQLEYWKGRLAGELPVLDLPTDRPRPALQSFRSGSESLSLSSQLSAGIRTLNRREGATLFMTLLAAFKVLVHRLSGQDDIVVGSPIAGRNRAEVEGMLGFFINTLVLRSGLGGNPPFRELLAGVREEALGAYAHQELPFEKLVAELHPDRDLARTPLFQVFFNVLNLGLERIELPGLAIEELAAAAPPSKFDLTLYVSEVGDTIQLRLVYNAILFDRPRMAETLVQLEALLAAVVEYPEVRIDSVSLLTPAARAVLPDPAAPLVRDPGLVPVHELFVRRALAAPQQIAVAGGEEIWTYGELDAQANRLARRLTASGLRAGEVVAIDAWRSASLAWAVLGTLKAGGAFLLLDPAYPAARLAAYLRLADPRVLVRPAEAEPLPAEMEETLAALPLRCRLVPADLKGEDPRPPAIAVAPDDLAYVAFTSGSTGTPKGILGAHGPLSHFLGWHARTFGLQAGDRFALLSGLAHDPLLRDLFTPLALGAELRVPDPGTYEDPGRLLAWLARERVSVVHVTPALVQMLAQAPNAVPGSLPALRLAFFGGDLLTGRDVARLRTLAPGARCVNFYGATETPQAMGFHPVEGPAGEPGRQALPVGRGIDGVQLLVVNPQGGLAGVGELGEIRIRTPYLALGYLGDEALTRERFPVNPFTEDPGDRVYRTGDLGRYRPDGGVEFAGRADAQVKIRGFRIEPAEVEAALARHPGIAESVVIAREEDGERRLVAYVVPRRTPEGEAAPDLSPAALRPFFRELLPAYAIPSAFVTLEAIPLTPNRKVDRAALPAPEAPAARERTAPRDDLEARMAAIWGEVLGVPTPGIHDDFFDLGGHSLKATQLVARLGRACGVNLPLRSLFQAPTVARLADEVRRLLGEGGGGVDLPALVPRPEERYQPFPLTDVQQAYWVGRSGAFELGGVATHSYLEIESAELDLRRFERAWQRLINRHDMLRAVFLPDGRQQVLEAVPPYRVEVLDLRGRPREVVESELARVREELSHQVLQTDRWPLFDLRATLLDGPGGQDRIRLHISRDALIYDAWSSTLLGRELVRLYLDPAAELPPLEITFRDYVMMELALRETEAWRRSLEYWRDHLATLPPGPELPLAKSPAALAQPRFERRRALLGAEPWGRFQARAAACGLTASAAVMAAFSEILTTWSKSPRFTLNLTLFNRLPVHPQVDQVIGDFTSLTLLEVDASTPGESFETRGKRLQERLWTDLDHRLVGGVRVVRELARARRGHLGAAMPVVFTSTLAQTQQAARQSAGASTPALAEAIYSITQTPQVWLDHQVFEQAGALVLNWDAVEELFPPGLLDDMFNAYQRLVGRLAQEGAEGEEAWRRPVTASFLMPPAQLAQRAEVNATAESFGPRGEALLHELFHERAARHPERAAVIAPDRTLTYGELACRATPLARRLRELGARPNELIAVVMEKGWEQVVAVLAILEAGAAYLPVDPTLPAERLAYLIENGRARIALVQPRLEEALAWPEGLFRVPVGADDPQENAGPLPRVQGPGDLAYVIFTSGSTGQPKGVMINHRGAVNTVLDVNRRFRVGPEDRVLALSALNFDLSVWDIFGLLAAGGALVLPEPEARRDPSRWAELVARHGVTLWDTVPALMEMFTEYATGRPEARPPWLRLVMMSGDWIPVSLPDRIRALVPAAEIWSLGGATEASIWSILYPTREVDPSWTSIPYGKPMVNQTFHVLDAALEPRPVWVPGLLYIGGIGVALGYWGDEEKTRASFLRHPATGERLYRTGDLGRYLPDGNIEFLGREDTQVKVQGYRIELGEIEAALGRHPAVRDAVVLALGEPRGNRRLAAYVVPAESEAPAVEDLRVFLRGKLPEYMVPTTWVLLDALPLTANGKVDRQALPAPEAAAAEREDAVYVAPRTPAEECLAGLWAQLLGVARVGVHDNFFELGGDSVLAIQIVARAREAGLELSPVHIFRGQTVACVAEMAQQAAPAVARAASEAQPVPAGADLAAANLSDDELARFLASLGGSPSE